MSQPIVFPYKIYKDFPCPIIKFELSSQIKRIETEAYVDSGASVSLFSIIDAQRLKLDYTRGEETFSTVGDGGIIQIFLHKLQVKIGDVSFKATVGFSPRLGVGFNLIGRRDFFNHFDITFSDSNKTITFLPIVEK
jgi:hypothetical protein